ncbi:lysine--tRNA ligase, partial [Candidatus Microgenomates bacterium]|nr:lysine--tRNA ligase [Candidatus Microgenomates bacterium]
MPKPATSKFWLDIATQEIVKQYPKGEIVVSSGISPSATYHIGHFREILTADALTWGLRQAGRRARHIHVVDNFDPLRKRYDFLPKWLEKHVGQPICLIPDPVGKCHRTYGDHFYKEFEVYARKMGIYPDQVIKSYEDLYKTGKMAGCFEAVLANVDKIHAIFKRVANRELETGWTPV